MRRTALGLVAGLALLAAGCTAEDEPAGVEVAGAPSPFAGCAALTAPPAGPSSASPVPGPSASAVPGSSASAPASALASDASDSSVAAGLPDLELPCFTGGEPVRLSAVRGPAVINLWATWCGPCREELPVVQELAARTAGRVHVIGVDTGDSRDAAASFGTDLRITVPTLYDRDRRMAAALGRASLPVTVFVDAAGRRTVHPLPMDAAELTRRLRETTGVEVAG